MTDAEPLWLNERIVQAVHDEQLAEHGGLPGVRDASALAAILARPRNLLGYEGVTDLHRLAASYAFGIATGHPFNDANKRTAFVVAVVFLAVNGLRFEAPEEDVVPTMLELTTKRLNEMEFAAWLARWTRPTG